MFASLSAVLGLTAAAAYLAGALVQARSFLNNSEVDSEVRAPLLMALCIMGVVAHGIANYLTINTDTGFNLGIYTSASLVSWIMLVFVLITNLRLPVQNMLIVILPLAILGIFALLSGRGDAATIPMTSFDNPLIWHILISVVAYSILFMAACQSLLLGFLENRLRTRRTIRLLKVLPPLQTMEALLFNLLWTGIVALTLAIGSGFVFLDNMFEQRVVHHTFLAIASWVLYAGLLAGHSVFGWRGTTAVRWTLIAFTLLVLGYFGSKFVIEILLDG
jgi:ABC-type uncharacterized transport system permease subunit